MTAVLLCWLAAADPTPGVATHTITRGGVTCIETVAPQTMPLTGAVRLTLTAEGAAPLAVEPVMFPNPPGWRVRGTDGPTVRDLAGGRQRWEQSFRLTPDKPGDLPLPPPALRVRAGGRETTTEIDWPPLTVRVTTTLPRADIDEARGITGPEPALPAAEPWWKDGRLWAALLVVAAVTAALLAGRKPPPGPVPEPPPHEWAKAELDRLAAQDPADPATADALADLLRGFLARQYGIAAAGKTTAEVLALLRPVSPDAVTAWQALLDRCDVARFAGTGFTPADWPGVLEQARRLTAASLSVGEGAAAAGSGPVGENG